MSENPLLNYKSYGQGQPVYILHGLFGMLDNWHSFARQLAERCEVILIDLRNHGRSFHSKDHDYGSMAEDVIQLMDELGHSQVSIIGHSMGGKTAAQLALNHPERVDKLVVVDILPIAYERGHDKVLEALNGLEITKSESRQELTKELTSALGGDVSTAHFLMKSLKRQKKEGFEWRFNLDTLTKEYDQIRKELKGGPFEGATLFIKGSLSNYINMSGWMEATEFFPHADLEEVEGAGHWIHADKPDELLQVVETFIFD